MVTWYCHMVKWPWQIFISPRMVEPQLPNVETNRTCLKVLQGILFLQVPRAVIPVRSHDFNKYWYSHLWKTCSIQTWAGRVSLWVKSKKYSFKDAGSIIARLSLDIYKSCYLHHKMDQDQKTWTADTFVQGEYRQYWSIVGGNAIVTSSNDFGKYL